MKTERTRPSARRPQDEPPSVLAIVVTHNGREWLRDCLVGLANQTYGALDVLVVDDASDGHRAERPTIRRIAKRHLRRRRWGYLRTPRPLGFGGAINWALGRVRTDVDLLLFVHDDAALTPTSVQQMVERMVSDEHTAIIGPKVVAWDDPARLEEVGMAADRFGYPYKGLEEGEIDLGQHDTAAEVFYVTSTCMLVRHTVFRDVHGWDARMRAFAEDLDLCWRTRLAGHTVRVEPRASARHAMALATGQRRSPFSPTRYFVRRNRFRAVTKNASGLRLIALVPQFLLLAFLEMIAFVFLRQPGEIVNLARAIAWNGLRLPQTIAERARVQRRRRVPDRALRRLTVRETTRLRFYVGHQATRVEEAWGRRTELMASRGSQLRAMGRRLTGPQGAVLAIVALVVVLGFRHVLWSDPAVAGELLPFPERPTALLRAYLSSWNGAGLGHPNTSPPAFGLLGLLPIATLGATGFAQKALVVVLGSLAFAGAYRMLSELIDRPSRVVAGLAYAFGAVGYAGLREGALGAMVFGAAAPFVIGATLRLLGWMRPPRFQRGRAVARIVLGGAVSAAFVPGSLLLYALSAVVLALTRAFWARGEKVARGLIASALGLAGAWALLLPWSVTWSAPGGPLARLTGDETWRRFAASFTDHGMASVVLGQTPRGMVLLGLAMPLLGVVAVVVGDGVRRRIAIGLWGVVVLCGALAAVFSAGLLRPIVASPTEAGVPAAVAFAGLAGLAVGAFRLDLGRHTLGWIQPVTIAAIGVSAFLVAASVGPALWNGAWDPGRSAGSEASLRRSITALLASEVRSAGDFRTLWVGERWGAGGPSAIRPQGGYLLTDPDGERLSDLFYSATGRGEDRLRDAVASIESGSTDLGGHLLGAFDVDFVIAVPGPDAAVWLAQRDLALIRSEPGYLVFRNEASLAHAAVYEVLPEATSAVGSDRAARFAAQRAPAPERNLTPTSPASYELGEPPSRGAVLLAESDDDGWSARLGDRSLDRLDAGWANGWSLPDGGSGSLSVTYDRPTTRTAIVVIVIVAWVVTVGAVFSRRRHPVGGRR